MVIQRSWKNAESAQQNSSSEDSNGSWQFQLPSKSQSRQSSTSSNMQNRPPINRQVAVNTLAAVHRRFSLPGPMQPYSRPMAEFRATANKSLDMLRQTIQAAVTKDIDHVIKKYLEKFFVPAVQNIRMNLGEESVGEDQVRAVCRAMLDAARASYNAPPRIPPSSPCDMSDSESSNGADSRFGRPHSSPSYSKRKESDTDSDTGSMMRRKKIKVEETLDDSTVTGGNSRSSSPKPSLVTRDPQKWNPARLTPETLFIMGPHAHRVLGLGNSRGRLYTKHSGLVRYPADATDKEWIANNNLMNPVGGRAYIMVLEDIEELAASDLYRHNSLPLLGELTGFRAPAFMLRKIKSFLARHQATGLPESPCSPLVSENENIQIKEENIKLEELNDEDIQIEDIKVEEIKVEDIKLECEDNISDSKGFIDQQSDIIDGLTDSDIDFLSSDLASIEREIELRKGIDSSDNNQDTLSLVGDEFDLGSAITSGMSFAYPDTPTTKCITVASTTSGMVHSVPVSHLSAPARLTGNAHYQYTNPQPIQSCLSTRTTTIARGVQPNIQHFQHGTVTLQNLVGASQQIRGIPITAKAATFGTVVSQGSGSNIISFGSGSSVSSNILNRTNQFVTVSPKTFTSGNFLHNAIVSRNMVNRSLNIAQNSGMTYNINCNMRPIVNTTIVSKTPSTSVEHITVSKLSSACDSNIDTSMSTTKDMIDNACNSSMMLKKVLTLGSAGVAKSFMMPTTQKLVTPISNTSPTVTAPVISSNSASSSTTAVSTLSASHATLSALLSGSSDMAQLEKIT